MIISLGKSANLITSIWAEITVAVHVVVEDGSSRQLRVPEGAARSYHGTQPVCKTNLYTISIKKLSQFAAQNKKYKEIIFSLVATVYLRKTEYIVFEPCVL